MLCTECKKEQEKRIPNEEKRKCTARRKSVQRRTYNTEIKAFSRFDTFDWCYAYAYNGVHSFLACHVAKSATRQQRPCE